MVSAKHITFSRALFVRKYVRYINDISWQSEGHVYNYSSERCMYFLPDFFFADFVCPTILSVFVTENISILSCILIKIIILDTVFLDLMSLLSVNGVLNNAQVKGDRTQK